MPKDLTALRELLKRHPAPWRCAILLDTVALFDAGNNHIVTVVIDDFSLGEAMNPFGVAVVALVNDAAEGMGARESV